MWTPDELDNATYLQAYRLDNGSPRPLPWGWVTVKGNTWVTPMMVPNDLFYIPSGGVGRNWSPRTIAAQFVDNEPWPSERHAPARTSDDAGGQTAVHFFGGV